MFRFTIRDVLWLMVVVALVIGWIHREFQLSRSADDADNCATKYRMATKLLEEYAITNAQLRKELEQFKQNQKASPDEK